MTNNVPLSIYLNAFDNVIDLNDGICSLENTPITSSVCDYINMSYATVEDTIMFNVKHANYQVVLSRINDITRFVYAFKQRSGSFEKPRIAFTISGKSTNDEIYTYIEDIDLELPDTVYDVSTTRYVRSAKLKFKHKSWKRRNTSAYSTTASGTIPNVFTVSGLDYGYGNDSFFPSSMSISIYPFAHSMQRFIPSGYVIVSNDPQALKIVDLNTSTFPVFTQVSESTARSGTILRFTAGQINASGLYDGSLISDITGTSYFPNYYSNNPFPSHHTVHMFGAVRCSGVFEYVGGLIDSSNTIRKADPVYFEDYSLPHIVYMGTIASSSLVHGRPYFSVRSLTTSGFFDLDYIAFVGTDNGITNITRIDQTSLSGIDGGSITFLNPVNASLGHTQFTKYFDNNPTVLFNGGTYGISSNLTTFGNQIRTINTFGTIDLRWNLYSRYGGFDTSAIYGGSKGSAYIMILSTCSGGMWSYRTISGVASSHNVDSVVTSEYPYIPRI